MRRTLSVVALGTFLLAPLVARADDTPTTGAATALFDEGVALMNQGRFSEACPKLAKSQELGPTGGTLQALADCYEKNSQFASAWVAYKELADRAAAAQKPDVERKANEAALRVETRISKLTIDVPSASAVDGLVIKRDGKAIAQAEWNVAMPMDPGPHVFEASAPGRQSWSQKITIADRPSTRTLAVPVLATTDTAGPPKDQPTAPASSSGNGQRILGLVVGGVGLAGVAVGAIFGLQASSKNDDASKHCVNDTRCDAQGIDLDKQAHDAATISTIGFIAGGALLAGGAVLYFTAPKGTSEPAASAAIRPTAGGATVSFGATF